IAPEDVVELENQPHITVKYGLHSQSPRGVQRLLDGLAPLVIQFGRTSFFAADDFDVVMIEILSDDLHRLNKLITTTQLNTTTYPTYHPHLTLAYVKKGRGAVYVNNRTLDGYTFVATSVTFSTKTAGKTIIPLQGSLRVAKRSPFQ